VIKLHGIRIIEISVSCIEESKELKNNRCTFPEAAPRNPLQAKNPSPLYQRRCCYSSELSFPRFAGMFPRIQHLRQLFSRGKVSTSPVMLDIRLSKRTAFYGRARCSTF
jgi:hypothetical protein